MHKKDVCFCFDGSRILVCKVDVNKVRNECRANDTGNR